MTDNNVAKSSAKRARRMAREHKANKVARAISKRETKITQVLALLGRPEGATLAELVASTGWLPHTARAAMTGLKKMDHVITSDKPVRGVRTYRITRVAEASR